ncbi:uncharacterized protein LOC132760347 [Ruditapes philippinarum]|uniref:uncharacterized protein LOC132760347 n=1 Tax=Ruditapes philippinarum TaxID=129788 RepID=UPI00295AF403|nr:uncharacterized protein LOC132760347 [Ruditapes philippinarum]XP_060608302.1 uncharacterized protein LOC132760347 [Ruditapes philippinarum]XP_060608304.1 uncharacterized protein LOC132760347 [Ruditapes philippinarum]XP_060608305.1 uncharacterized protein LOC132760347 [Ruditapes philippinarum]XP_060608306.1 uncharacterized protein LOC132760347 [Ruditapes philippinarum]XP_060608307.1 uncharacterized protein LOC132760347 [Ruditapes philippinarum]
MGVLRNGSNSGNAGRGRQETNNVNSTTTFQMPYNCSRKLFIEGIGFIDISIVNGREIKLFDIEFRSKLKENVSFSLEERKLKIQPSFYTTVTDKEIDPDQDVMVTTKVTQGNLTIRLKARNGNVLLHQQTEISNTGTDLTQDVARTNIDEDADVDDTVLAFVEVSSPGDEHADMTDEGAIAAAPKSICAPEGDKRKKEDSVDDVDDDEDDEFVEIE